MSTEAQASMDQSELFPLLKNVGESGDLFALGEIAIRILSESLHEKNLQVGNLGPKRLSRGGFPRWFIRWRLFRIGDISKFGFSPKETPKDISSKEIREKERGNGH